MAHAVMGAEDTAWLHMEEPANPMVVNGVLELSAPLPLERAYALIERLAAIPRFRSRVVEPPLHLGPASWAECSDFDMRQHVEHEQLASASDLALRTFIGRAVSGRLDMSRPLWRIYLIDRPGMGGRGGHGSPGSSTTILFRVHHSMADGFALLSVLLSLCDAPRDAAVSRASAAVTERRSRSRTALGAARALGRLVALPPDPRTLLKGSLGHDKRVAWSDLLPLPALKKAAHAATATVNDVLVATTAGALRRYLERRGESTAGLEIHAMVPVDLRRGAAASSLGNRFGFVVLGLPIGVVDPLERIAVVKHRMKELKATSEAVATYGVLRAIGRAPRRVEDLAVSFFGKKSSLVLTNVPGPRSRLSLAGVPVSRIMFWVPQSGRMGLGISIFSYAGEVTIGVMCDAALVPDPEALVADLHAEHAELLARVGRVS